MKATKKIMKHNENHRKYWKIDGKTLKYNEKQ